MIGTGTLHVLFRVGDADYVVPAQDVLQMETFKGATRVPGTPKHVAGLVQVRGRVLPVIDLRIRFGLPAVDTAVPATPAAATPAVATDARQTAPVGAIVDAIVDDRRLVIVTVGQRAVALLADRAREVVRIEPDLFRPAPDGDDGGSFVSSVAQTSGRMVMRLDLARLVGTEPLQT